MYDDILLPTDGSDAADAAVDNAFSLAERYDAALHVLYVADEGIDAVVMGTHGRRGLGRALLGSVTERVVRTSDVPEIGRAHV